MKWYLLIGLFFILPLNLCWSDTHDYSIQPKDGDNFLEAHFRLWLPDHISKIQGLLLLIPGWNQPGLQWCQDHSWQELARKWECGILACQWESSESGPLYYQVEGGSGQALCKAINELSKMSKHVETAESPLVFCGYSAGGQFAYHFACWKPEKVLGLVAIKGGFYEREPTDLTRQIPGLWIAGQNDEKYRIENITNLVTENAKKGALWSMAIEPHSGHEIGRSFELAQVYLDDVLRLRATNTGAFTAPIDPQKGWWASIKKMSSQPAIGAKPNTDCVWLPGEDSANAWISFQK